MNYKGRYWVKTLGGFLVGTTADIKEAAALKNAFLTITGREAYIYDTFGNCPCLS